MLLDAVLGQSAQTQAAPESRRPVMARSRSELEQVRRAAYKFQRGIGTYQAASRGPAPLAKRLVRRDLTRTFFRILRQMGK
jgi:hypothetical protein